MSRSSLLAAVVVVASVAGMACSEPPPFQVVVRVESDPGEAVPNATLITGPQPAVTTDGAGRATLTLRGKEGQTVDVLVRCPDGLVSPLAPLAVRLAGPSEAAQEYVATCAKSARRVVVDVRATNGPNLPVLYHGRAVARTDASGAARFALDVAPSTELVVALDTSGEGGEKLSPKNPTKQIKVGTRDEHVVWEQVFEVTGAPARRAQ